MQLLSNKKWTPLNMAHECLVMREKNIEQSTND